MSGHRERRPRERVPTVPLALRAAVLIGALLVAAPAAPAAPALPRALPADSARVLRVCADPNNLPFSNRRGEGFENAIARRLARDLGARLVYDWAPQGRGFVRKRLKGGHCDAIIGVPYGFGPVRTTRPYYRSTYVALTRRDAGAPITSLDDPRLRRLRIGVHVVGDDYQNTPPVQALAARGIVDNVAGFTLFGDYARPSPALRLPEAVADGTLDVAIVWGPFAGFVAGAHPGALALAPLTPALDRSGQRFAFDIAVGVRRGDAALAAALDAALARDAAGIHRILVDYGVPLAPATTRPAREPDAPATHTSAALARHAEEP